MSTSTSSLTNLDILIIEDDDNDAELMSAALARTGFVGRLRRVQTEADFRRELLTAPDAILSDYTVPGFGARRALSICAELGSDIPFIVVTGSISEEVAVDCMKRGAADYLLKDRLVRLGAALEQAVITRQERRQKQKAERARDAAMRELDHRVRNNMAVVVGLAELSIRSAASLESFAPVFMGRVRALATVHDALGEKHWLNVDLRSLIMRIVQPVAYPCGGELELVGDPTPLPPRAVQPLGLTLYELARNATQHGVWRTRGRKVRISWSSNIDTALNLLWEECDDASTGISQERIRNTDLNLVEELIRNEIRGTISMAFLPQGLRVSLILPAEVPAEAPDPISN